MEEKAKKDRKIKDKKVSIKSSTCYYIAGVCFMLTAILSAIMGETPSIWLMYAPLGLLYMVLGQNTGKKEESQSSDSEDEKNPQ